jgi:hypothetical protein
MICRKMDRWVAVTVWVGGSIDGQSTIQLIGGKMAGVGGAREWVDMCVGGGEWVITD